MSTWNFGNRCVKQKKSERHPLGYPSAATGRFAPSCNCQTGMLEVTMRPLLPINLLIGLMLSALTAGAASVSCKPARVDVGGYKLWMQVAGVGEPAVVFESGGGDDSSVWAKIESEIRR